MAQAFISTGDALSRACMKLRSWKFALPAPLPPPIEPMPVCATPQDHESTSISPSCLLSFDSPLTSPSFRNTSTAIASLLYYAHHVGRRNSDGHPKPPCPSPKYLLARLTGLGGRQLGDQPQRHRKSFQLIVRPQEELGRVVPRVALDCFHLHLRRGKGLLSLGRFR